LISIIHNISLSFSDGGVLGDVTNEAERMDKNTTASSSSDAATAAKGGGGWENTRHQTPSFATAREADTREKTSPEPYPKVEPKPDSRHWKGGLVVGRR